VSHGPGYSFSVTSGEAVLNLRLIFDSLPTKMSVTL
jgi:hypothetical protein